jgi:prepilin-type N-terminal cleavage/methylation domain-containing protein/prepilin-type processing-associated H-X9-DG protein
MRKQAGFTLIELLVVISVIVLLMALLLPVLRRVRNQTKAVICQSNLKQWGQIMGLFTHDNEGGFINAFDGGFQTILHGPIQTNNNSRLSSHYSVRTDGIRCCPMATTTPKEPAQLGSWTRSSSGVELWNLQFMDGSTFGAWEVKGLDPPFRCSYGFNYRLFSHLNPRILVGSEVFSVKNSWTRPVFLDAAYRYALPGSKDNPPLLERHDGGIRMQSFCVNRHNGYTNGLFLDWSVRRIGLKELWTLKWHNDFDTAGPWTKAGGALLEDWPHWMRGFKDY